MKRKYTIAVLVVVVLLFVMSIPTFAQGVGEDVTAITVKSLETERSMIGAAVFIQLGILLTVATLWLTGIMERATRLRLKRVEVNSDEINDYQKITPKS